MQNTSKFMLCALLLLASFSVWKGPTHTFFQVHQTRWLGIPFLNQKELVKGLNKIIEKKFKRGSLNLGKKIVEASIRNRIDPVWVTAIIWTESSFNITAISSAGARGLMQLMPSTAKEVLKDFPNSNPRYWLDTEGNLLLGGLYLSRLLEKFNGNHKLATMAYNLGRAGLLRRIEKAGVPKMKYWRNIRSRYQYIIYELGKSEQIAKADSVKYL